MFQLTVPNYASAMPVPRADPPISPGFGEVAAGALLSSFAGIASEYQQAQDNKFLAIRLADAIEEQDPIAANQLRAVSTAIKPNYLATKSRGSSGKTTQGLLEDAISMIQAGQKSREAERMLRMEFGNRKDIEGIRSKNSLGLEGLRTENDIKLEGIRATNNENIYGTFDEKAAAELDQIDLREEWEYETRTAVEAMQTSDYDKKTRIRALELLVQLKANQQIDESDASEILSKINKREVSGDEIMAEIAEKSLKQRPAPLKAPTLEQQLDSGQLNNPGVPPDPSLLGPDPGSAWMNQNFPQLKGGTD